MMLEIDTIIFQAYFKSIYTFCGIQNFINSKADNPIDFYTFVSLAYSLVSTFCFFLCFFIYFPSCDLIPPMLLLLRFYVECLVPRRTGKKVINNFEVDIERNFNFE